MMLTMPVVAPRPMPTVSTIVAVSTGVTDEATHAVESVSPEIGHGPTPIGPRGAESISST